MSEIQPIAHEFNAVVSSEGMPLFVDPHKVSVGDFVRGFYTNFVEGWKGHKPQLKDIAGAMITNLRGHKSSQFDKYEEILVHALLKVAERAQINKHSEKVENPQDNLYHDSPHSGHVGIMGFFQSKDMTVKRRLLKMIADFGHDVDHPGRANKPQDIFEIERNSLEQIIPIMEGAGVETEDIEFVRMMILGTSINGPAQYIKNIIEAAYNCPEVVNVTAKYSSDSWPLGKAIQGREIELGRIMKEAAEKTWRDNHYMPWATDKNKFLDQLKVFAPLQKFTLEELEFTQTTHAADVEPSLIMPDSSARKLTDETKAADPQTKLDFTMPAARMFFLNQFVGRGMFERNRYLKSFLPVFGHFKREAEHFACSGEPRAKNYQPSLQAA